MNISTHTFAGILLFSLVFCRVESPILLAANGAGQSHQRIELAGVRTHQLDIERESEQWILTTTGNDPFLEFELPAVDGSRADGKTLPDQMLAMDTFCVHGVSQLQFFVGRPFQRQRMILLPKIEESEGWTTYIANLSELASGLLDFTRPTSVRLDFGDQIGIQIRLKNVRLRSATDREVQAKRFAEQRRAAKQSFAEDVDQYWRARWPAQIDKIVYKSDEIQITGKTLNSDAAGSDQLRLVPRFPAESSVAPIGESSGAQSVDLEWLEGGRFQAKVSADANSRLKDSGVRWQLVRPVSGGWEPASFARYVDRLDASRQARLDAQEKLRAAKGLTCMELPFTEEQLQELGLRHGAINVVLNGLVRRTSDAGYEPITVRGRQLYMNSSRVRALDRRARTLHRAGVQVAAVILISRRESDPLVHPEAVEAGVYSMPNLKQADSAEIYGLTLDFLAQRYAQVGEPHGRIDQWIVHNEIDAGWNWTNMGEQPMEAFLDHYFRSLRMVDLAVRRVNPHARAFISLTHHWNSKDSKPWRWYAPRSILMSLLRHTKAEGNFPWTVAYHPYPEDLWDAAVWDDRSVTDDVDTSKITIKNLQVLDRFLTQDEFALPGGGVRDVLCSEQGFHCPEDDSEKQRIQAAALLYTFEKLRQCPSVIAFDYHRPVDHPNEGGLRLGLRGLANRSFPSPQNRIGKPKLGYEVYQAIGTPREDELREQFEHYWSNE